ncbi:MAG: hypothetical protein V2A34_08950 [Lentisphaerota bacterium]
MSGVTITGFAREKLRRLTTALNNGSYRPALGQAGARIMVDHFSSINRSGAHKSATELGAKPSELYAEFAEATNYQVEADGVLLTVAHHAIRQRYYGGRIDPVNASRLTLPARAEAYGRRAGTVGVPLDFHYAPDPKTGRWRPALVSWEGGTRVIKDRRKGHKGEMRTVPDKRRPPGVWFWLVRHVNQQGDHTVIPTREQFIEGTDAALKGWVEKLIGNQNA